MKITPSKRSIVLLGLWTLAGFIPVFVPVALVIWLGLGAVLLIIALIDFLLPRPRLQGERFVSNILPVGIWSPVRLRIHNHSRRAQQVKLFDHYLQPAEFSDLPQTITIAAKRWGGVAGSIGT